MPVNVVQAVPRSASKSKDIAPRTFFVALLLLICCLYMLLARDSYMEDFHSYYTASVALHDHLDPYFNQVNVSERYADGKLDTVASEFVYPPSALFFVAPLRYCSYRLERIFYATGISLAMVGILVFLTRRFPGTEMVALALFLSLPMIANVDQGQIDIVILALMLTAFYRGDSWLGGACLGVAIAIKLAPVLALGWFFGARRWRSVAGSVLVAGVATLAAFARWGMGWQREFLQHMLQHDNGPAAMLHHSFQGVQLVNFRFIVVDGAVYSFERFVYGYLQNPLLWMGRYQLPVALALVLGYLGWLFWSRQGRALSTETGFFGFLALALLANRLLWLMGLVACFPLLLLIVDRSATPRRTTVLLLAPFFLPGTAIANHRFVLWLAVAAFCVWQNARDARELPPKAELLSDLEVPA